MASDFVGGSSITNLCVGLVQLHLEFVPCLYFKNSRLQQKTLTKKNTLKLKTKGGPSDYLN